MKVSPAPVVTSQSRYHVPNLTRALKIIEVLAENPAGLTTAQLTSILKIPRNSIFRITSTLLEHGYLIRDDEKLLFQLSKKLLTLGCTALSDESLIEKSLPVMRQLRDRFKETVPLGILNGNQGLVVEEMQGLHSFRFVLEPGRRFHLHSAAPGKAIVAFLPQTEQGQIIDSIKFHKANERTITNKQTYLKVLARTKRQGYAVDRAEEIEGMHCIAAPVFNRHGYPIAAIWLTGPSYRIREKDFKTIGPVVCKAALRISHSLGYYQQKERKNGTS